MTSSQNSTLLNLNIVTEALLDALDARSRDIVTRRYGIRSGTPETLESIGREYGITRERVRQIQTQAKKVLTDLQPILEPIQGLLDAVFTEEGGIMAEPYAITAVQERLSGSEPSGTVVVFYLDILPPYQYVSRHSHFAPHWRQSQAVNQLSEAVVKAAREILNKKRHPISSDELTKSIREALAANQQTLPDRHIDALLVASKALEKTPFGEWGLLGWPETNPRGVGDKAYAVLRRHSKPEHFTDITDLINRAHFDHKEANAQTVHNELIKDDRFVLVGRGLYGLTEWGYIPGTVADVIASLLARAREPLTREEVIEQVLAQRQVKKNTILLGLQNQKRFIKTPENRYTLKVK